MSACRTCRRTRTLYVRAMMLRADTALPRWPELSCVEKVEPLYLAQALEDLEVLIARCGGPQGRVSSKGQCPSPNMSKFIMQCKMVLEHETVRVGDRQPKTIHRMDYVHRAYFRIFVRISDLL